MLILGFQYTGLAQADPYNIDLSYSTFALGVILGTLGQVGALSALAIGCVLVDSTNVLTVRMHPGSNCVRYDTSETDLFVI